MISIHLIIVAVVIVIGVWSLHETKSNFRTVLTDTIEKRVATLIDLSELTDGNGADELAARMIVDCPKRNEFEALLNRLGKLSHRELLSVQQLFDSCGYFYTDRKTLMVSKLESEFEVFEENLTLLDAFEPEGSNAYNLEKWRDLVELENKRSALMREQTIIQEDIIIALIAGSQLNAKSITDLISRAGDLNELLGVLDKQIDEIRNTIIV